MSGTKHYLDHYEVDESRYGEYRQDGSTDGERKKIENEEDGGKKIQQ